MQKITPFLWFNGRAEEAVNFYTSIFPNSKIIQLSKLPGGPSPGSVIATYQIEGQQFMALDGGPQFTFTPAISLMVNCETQQEVDTLWEKLSSGGGKPLQCGWLQDKFGISWQIVPTAVGKLMHSEDQEKRKRVFAALMQMTKLDIQKLQDA
jgi:predicted 3-demethylubiquinone-9 3-methyltransferase (glyoxalase superfamily)